MSYTQVLKKHADRRKLAVDLQVIWDAIVRFCEDNSIWLIIGAELAAILLAVNAIKKDGRVKQKKEDAWMQGFEARMEAFEKNEDPLMPVRRPLLSLHREEEKPEKAAAEKPAPIEKNTEEPVNLNVKIRIGQVHITRELAKELTEAMQQEPDGPVMTISRSDEAGLTEKTEAEPAARTDEEKSTASGRSGRVYSEEELRKLIRK